MQLRDDYLAAYRSLKLTRDADGVLVVEFHSKGGPFIFTAQDHTEFVDAFYRIAQDRANKIVILTGAGGEFIPEIDFSSFGNVAEPGVWSQVHDEGVQILENIANIRVLVEADSDRILGFTAFGVGAGDPGRRPDCVDHRAALHRAARCGPDSPNTGRRSHTSVLIRGVSAQRRRDKRSPDLRRMR